MWTEWLKYTYSRLFSIFVKLLRVCGENVLFFLLSKRYIRPVESCQSCCKISWINFDLVNLILLLINAEWCFQTLRMGAKWGSGACPLAHAQCPMGVGPMPCPCPCQLTHAHIATSTCPLLIPMPTCPVHQSSLYLHSSRANLHIVVTSSPTNRANFPGIHSVLCIKRDE